MNKLFPLLLAVSALAHGQGASSTWCGSLAEAKDEAAKEHKLVLVYLFVPWDTWCQKTDREVWMNADVQKSLVPSYKAVREDGDEPEGRIIRNRYHTNSYPAFLVLSPNGKLLFKANGY